MKQVASVVGSEFARHLCQCSGGRRGTLPCHLKFGRRLLGCHVVNPRKALPTSLVRVPAVQPVFMREDEVQLRLNASISGFADRVPLMSARNLVLAWTAQLLDRTARRFSHRPRAECPTDRHHDHRCVYPALPDRGGLSHLPLHSVVEKQCSGGRDGRGGADDPRLRVALLFDSAARLQRVLGHHQADREPRPD